MPCDTCPHALECPADLKAAVAEVAELYHDGRLALEDAAALIEIAHLLFTPQANAMMN